MKIYGRIFSKKYQHYFLCFLLYSYPAKTFENLENYLFDKHEKFQTNALLISQNGSLVYEKYQNKFDGNSPHPLWSISKSITSLIIGLAVDRKLLDINRPIAQYFPKITKARKGLDLERANKLTLKHLLQMSSGLEWNEGYEDNVFKSDVVDMLYVSKFKDMATFTAQKRFSSDPGRTFNYSSGESNLIMGLLKTKLGKSDYNDFPFRKLFSPLEISSATWEQDQSGTFVGSSYLYMSGYDLLKIGLLILNGGKWKNKQIISPEWINFSKELSPAVLSTQLKGKDAINDSYSNGWWLNRDLPQKGLERKYPSGDENILIGSGHYGQRLIIIPNKNMVIVRFGLDKEANINMNKLFSLLDTTLQKKAKN